jgi:hypothetical protein
VGEVLRRGELPVERGGGSYRRHGAQQELRHQQAGPIFWWDVLTPLTLLIALLLS